MPIMGNAPVRMQYPLSDDTPVPDMPALAGVLGELPGSATAHLLAACDTGGHPIIERLRGPFPEIVAAWEAWRRTPERTAGAIRAALGSHTRTRAR